MQQGIVNVLAALNREYLPSMEHKWVSRLLEGLEIKPDDCEARLRATFATDDLGQAVRDLVELGMEVIDLVEAHLPEVNETSLFEGHPWVNTTWARKRWVAYPAYTLIASMARGDGEPWRLTYSGQRHFGRLSRASPYHGYAGEHWPSTSSGRTDSQVEARQFHNMVVLVSTGLRPFDMLRTGRLRPNVFSGRYAA